MIQIRQNIFETNSSSTHSIVVVKDPSEHAVSCIGLGGYASYENGVLSLSEDNSFGWGWEVLTSWLDKFAYAVAEYRFQEDKLVELMDAVRQHVGCDEIVIPRRTLWNDKSQTEPDYGYIDHQSQGTLQEFLSRKDVDVLDFIFDEHYIVILDNDNNYGDTYASYIEKLDGAQEYPPENECWWRG